MEEQAAVKQRAWMLREDPVTEFATIYRPQYWCVGPTLSTATTTSLVLHLAIYETPLPPPRAPNYPRWFEVYNMYRRLFLTCAVLLCRDLAETTVFVIFLAIVTLVFEQVGVIEPVVVGT